MHIDWVTNPLVQYGVMGGGMVACLSLFLTFKMEVAQVRRRVDKSRTTLSDHFQNIESVIATLRDRVSAVEERPASAQRPGLNLTKRSQALRMHHRGESAETIAAALQTPCNEINLLLKVHKKLGSDQE